MRYFLITFYRKPGGEIDEQISVAKRLRTSDYSNCNVIVDFANKKVEKCVIEGNALDITFEKMVSYYKKIYPALIEQLEKEALITSNEKNGT
jgi:hypothetical protein